MLIKELHDTIGLTEWDIRQRAKTGRIPCLKSGNRYIFDIDLVEEFLKNEAMNNVKQAETSYNKYGTLRRINAS
jgi:hypothetical protein